MAKDAPFDRHIARATEAAFAVWLNASDGVRLRAAKLGDGTKGTVFLFSGRTEYIEKYGETGAAFATAGLSTLSIDWRGQGLSDRHLSDPLIGHVEKFTDYQKDVAALVSWAEKIDAPRPWFLLGHSMGGAVALRALTEGMAIDKAAFSGPMWGISLSPPVRAFAWVTANLSERIGFGEKIIPGGQREPYPLHADPADNLLTHDAEMLAWMKSQLEAEPGLGLGGPSLTWLAEALRETRKLQAIKDPKVASLTLLGDQEAIVDVAAIEKLTSRWPEAHLHRVANCRHEVLMESPALRQDAYRRLVEFYLS
ncbi:MAG: alpha/beta hydrolase [Pseudomonadota bacterium]